MYKKYGKLECGIYYFNFPFKLNKQENYLKAENFLKVKYNAEEFNII